MKKVLFVTYGGGHVKIAIPVIKELKKRGYKISVLGLTASVLALQEEGIRYNGLRDYINLFDDKKLIYALGRKYIDANFIPQKGLEKEEILLYLGLNIYDLSLQMGSIEKAEVFFHKHGRKEFYPYHTMKKIIQHENPDVIFVTCSVRSEKAAAIIGNELQIPVVRVVDLLGDREDIPYQAKVCVINEIAKKNIIDYNSHLKGADIIITGQPNLEPTYDYNELFSLKERYNTDKYKGIISFFSQPKNSQRGKVIEKLIEIFNSKPEYFCFYKLHPNEDEEFYKKYLSVIPPNMLLKKHIETNCIVVLSDIVMTFNSTVGLQAVYTNKPLITINLSDLPYKTEYSRYGCAVLLTDLDLLEQYIEKLLDPNDELNIKLAVNRKKIAMPQGSALNIADVIDDLL
jgi:hypothetical protein